MRIFLTHVDVFHAIVQVAVKRKLVVYHIDNLRENAPLL